MTVNVRFWTQGYLVRSYCPITLNTIHLEIPITKRYSGELVLWDLRTGNVDTIADDASEGYDIIVACALRNIHQNYNLQSARMEIHFDAPDCKWSGRWRPPLAEDREYTGRLIRSLFGVTQEVAFAIDEYQQGRNEALENDKKQ